MSDEFKFGEPELPPELSELENSLRALPLSGDSGIDRDELMFQSGWAAALAAESKTPATRSAASWGWPALTGTFASLSAALAIALFLPAANNDSPIASKPTAKTPQLVVDEPAKSDDGGANRLVRVPNDTENELDDQNLAPSVVRRFANRIFPLKPAATSALAIRHRSLREFELDDVRPRTFSVSTRPQAAPLKAYSHRNQQLLEQL